MDIAPLIHKLPPGHPDPFPDQKQPPRRYEYLINRDELVLIDATPRPLFPIQTFYLQEVVKDADGVLTLKTVTTIVKDSQDKHHDKCPMKW